MDNSKVTNYVISALVVVILLVVLGGLVFNYSGSKGYNCVDTLNGSGAVISTLCAQGLGNATANPEIPTFLPSLMVIAIAVGIIVFVFKTFKIS